MSSFSLKELLQKLYLELRFNKVKAILSVLLFGMRLSIYPDRNQSREREGAKATANIQVSSTIFY